MSFQESIENAWPGGRVSVRGLLVALQLFLLALLALLGARLIWTAVQPIGPVGTLPPSPGVAGTAADLSIMTRFDPFFQMPGSGDPLVVSDLDLDLYGTRVDNVSGRGSAIIGADAGPQRSFFVGEEIIPGVTLQSVAFDNVTIDRNGTLEQLFIDQSVPARTVGPAAADAAPIAAPAKAQITVEQLLQGIDMQPLLANGRVDGVTLAPVGDGKIFTQAGLMPGDVLLSVNRARIDTKARAEGIADLLGNANVAELEIRRGAQVQAIKIEIAQ